MASTRGHDGSTEKDSPGYQTQNLKQRLIGSANESIIIIENTKVKALIDTGSMVSTISEHFYQWMDNKPELKSLEDFKINLSGANEQDIPFIGYIEAEVKMPISTSEGMIEPILVVKSTDYNRLVPAIVGTNIV